MASAFNFASLVPKPTYLSTNDPTFSQYYGQINNKNDSVYSAALARAQMAQNLSNQVQGQYNEAKNANETRYNQILTGYDALQGDVKNAFANLSNQQIADVDQSTLNAKATNAQALVNSGMVGTTVLPSLNMQADKNSVTAKNRIRDAITQSQLGYLTNLGQGKLGVIQAREDTYPNTQFYSNLLQQFGNFSDVQYTYR